MGPSRSDHLDVQSTSAMDNTDYAAIVDMIKTGLAKQRAATRGNWVRRSIYFHPRKLQQPAVPRRQRRELSPEMSDSEEDSEDEIQYTYHPMCMESKPEKLVWSNSSSDEFDTSPYVSPVETETLSVSPVETETLSDVSPVESVQRQKKMTDFFRPRQPRGYTPELWWLSPPDSD